MGGSRGGRARPRRGRGRRACRDVLSLTGIRLESRQRPLSPRRGRRAAGARASGYHPRAGGRLEPDPSAPGAGRVGGGRIGRGSSRRRSEAAAVDRMDNRLGTFEGREGRHVGHPEAGQPALLVHFDVEAVRCPHHLHRTPRPDPQVEDALRRVGLDRERGIDLNRGSRHASRRQGNTTRPSVSWAGTCSFRARRDLRPDHHVEPADHTVVDLEYGHRALGVGELDRAGQSATLPVALERAGEDVGLRIPAPADRRDARR